MFLAELKAGWIGIEYKHKSASMNFMSSFDWNRFFPASPCFFDPRTGLQYQFVPVISTYGMVANSSNGNSQNEIKQANNPTVYEPNTDTALDGASENGRPKGREIR